MKCDKVYSYIHFISVNIFQIKMMLTNQLLLTLMQSKLKMRKTTAKRYVRIMSCLVYLVHKLMKGQRNE